MRVRRLVETPQRVSVSDRRSSTRGQGGHVDPISELGRRFQELSHGLIQVASKGAETHHSTNLLKRCTNEIMKEIEEDLRKSSQNCQDDNVQDVVDSISNVEAAKGFKRRGKKTVGGKPQKTWIGVLEKRSRGQSSQTQITSHNAIESPQPFAPMVGNYDSSQGMTSMTQLLQAQESLFLSYSNESSVKFF
ncbi:hypothetical protein QJS10_CPB21g01331 [Acorus calamus]|uniref:Uncharacterized protein n=1 Tax=Acorus calamus TaxID=4465 RepID=A0AAV9C4R7_ACOCL|nr:hypothetical protein QJS10_CPB21g01331 [Acorus calamus]